MTNRQEFIEELAFYTGTENYYEYNFFGLKMYLTDGIIFVMEQDACWLIDIIISFQPSLRNQPFQVWRLKHILENDSWEIEATDGNKNILVSQDIHFSDFILDEITIWVEDNVILLPSEH